MERDNDGATPAHFAAARGKYFAHARYKLFTLVLPTELWGKIQQWKLITEALSTLQIQGVDVESMKVTTGTFSHAE